MESLAISLCSSSPVCRLPRLVLFFLLLVSASFSPHAFLSPRTLVSCASVCQERVRLPTRRCSLRESAGCFTPVSLKFGDSTGNPPCKTVENWFLTAGKTARISVEESCRRAFRPGFSQKGDAGRSTRGHGRPQILSSAARDGTRRQSAAHIPTCRTFARHNSGFSPCRFGKTVDAKPPENPPVCFPGHVAKRPAAVRALHPSVSTDRMATAFLPSAPIRLSPALHGTVPRLKRRQASPQKLLFDPSSWFPSHGLQGRRSDMRYGYRRASSELRAGEGGTERARARDLENADKDKEQQSDAKKPSGKPRKRRRAWKARGEVPDQDLEGFVSERRSLPGKLKKGKENPPRLSSGLTSLLHVHQMLMTNRKQTSAQSTPFLASPPWTPGPTPETAERQSAAASLPRTGPVRSEPGAISGLFKTETDRARLANLAAPGGISPALVSAVQEARVRAIGSSEPGYRPLPLGPAQIPVPDGGWGHLHVVGGRFGGRRLMMPRGGGVRPMMAKVKEALFSMLQRMGVLGCVGEQRLRVLDLFSGSGALSVEAFSRGAEFALLADSSLDSCEAAAVNVQYCGVADRSYIVRASVEELLLVPERYLRLPSRLVEQTRHLRTIRKLCEEGKKLALASTEGRPVLQDALRALSTPESSSDVDRQGEEGSTEAPMALQHELRTLPDVGSSASQRLFESVVNEAANSERELGRKHTYGLVFLCPPYTKVVYKELIQLLLDCSIVGNDAVVVVEYPKEIGCLPYLIRSDASSAALVGLRNRAYGRTCIAVYCKQKLFSVADLARIQRTCPASMQEALVTDGNSGVSAHVEEQRPAEASQSDLHVTHVETETRVPTMPRSSEMHACRETVKGLLPISSLWYGQQRPEEFVPPRDAATTARRRRLDQREKSGGAQK